jgi:hypothetical protein
VAHLVDCLAGLGRGQDLPGLVQRAGHRLFAKNVDLALQGGHRRGHVLGVGRGDVHRLDIGVQQRSDAREGAAAKAAGQLLGLGRHDVGDAEDGHALVLFQVLSVGAAHVAAADDADRQCHRFLLKISLAARAVQA